MLSLCLHGPQSERASLVSLVPSEQWGQPSLAVWWGRGGQGPRPWGRGGDGPGWWEEPVPVPPCAPLPQPEARFSVLLLLSQPQVETAPGLPVPTPAPELVEWWPEVWGAPLACLLSSSPPALGASRLWAQGRGRGAQRPGSSLTQPDACVGLRSQATLCWACVPMCPGQGPRACPLLQSRVLCD